MISTFAAGFLLGLVGSLHCVGMCGALAFALPVHGLSAGPKAKLLAFYHAGRISMYTIAGLAFGLAGQWLRFAGMQRAISIFLGILLLLAGINIVFSRSGPQLTPIKKFNSAVQKRMIQFLNMPGQANYFLFGALNGLLPCGMVYVALAAALSTHSIMNAAVFMAGFGVATLPAMFALGFFGYMFSLNLRNSVRKMTPYAIAAVGVLLVLRGLNLGIPFISPSIQSHHANTISCH